MFEFFKEIDDEIYNEIINEVESNMWNDRCYSIIQSEIEKILKNVYRESNITITNSDNLGNAYFENNPSISQLLNNTDFKTFLEENKILDENSINSYWKIHTNANIKKHGSRTHTKFTSTDIEKINALKLLFDLGCNVYKYKLNNTPNALWDNNYCEKLLKKPSSNKNDAVLINKLEEENKELLKQKEQLNLELQQILKQNTIPITTTELTAVTKTELPTFKFKSTNIVKKIGKSSTKERPLENNFELIKIDADKNIQIKISDNHQIIFDYIKRGWFEEAENELHNFTKKTASDKYAEFLIKYKISDIKHFDFKKIKDEKETIASIISGCPKDIDEHIIDVLINAFNSKNFLVQKEIFDILYRFDFEKRDSLVEDFGKIITNRIISKQPLESKDIVNFVNSINSNFDNTIKNLIELCLKNNNFDIANSLNTLIKKDNPNNSYCLVTDLLITCKCQSIHKLSSCLCNLNCISHYELLSEILDNLNSSSPQDFLIIIKEMSDYLSNHTANNDNWINIYNVLLCLCKYDVPNRNKLISLVYQNLLELMPKANSVKIYDALHQLLYWSTSSKEFLTKCIELAYTSLDSQIKSKTFINELNKIAQNSFESIYTKFCYKYGMSSTPASILKLDTKINKSELEFLLEHANSSQRTQVLQNISQSLINSIPQNSGQQLINNLDSFNLIIKYVPKQRKKYLFEIMLNYADTLIDNGYFNESTIFLKQAMSLNINIYECCYRLMLCDYQVSTLEELYKCPLPVINNKFYNLSLKLASTENKEKYEKYLDIYDKQKQTLKQIEQKKIKQKKSTLNTATIYSWGLCILSLAVLCLGLGTIYINLIGASIFSSMCFIGLTSISITMFVSANKEPKKDPTIKKLIFAIFSLILCILITITTLCLVYNHARRYEEKYSSNYCEIVLGMNCETSEILIPSTKDNHNILDIYIDCSYNKNIRCIRISEGIKNISLDLEGCYNLDKLIIPVSTKSIAYNSLKGLNGSDIYYRGSKEQWQNIKYLSNYFNAASIHYNYTAN